MSSVVNLLISEWVKSCLKVPQTFALVNAKNVSLAVSIFHMDVNVVAVQRQGVVFSGFLCATEIALVQ